MKNADSGKRSSAAPGKVLVADDHELMREGIKILVAGVLGDVHFVEAENGDALFHVIASTPFIRLAILDLRMPGMRAGFRLIELARRHPTIPLLIVADHSFYDVVRRAATLPSVCACLPRSASANDVRLAIKAAACGTKLSYVPIGRGNALPPVALTPRQEEIRRLLSQAMSNKMIAGTLGISEATVKNHVTEIFKVLNVTNRTQAAQMRIEVE